MSAEEVSLGIDIGTGSTKAGLISGDGRLLAVGRSPHPINEPRPGLSESDPADWMTSVAQATAGVLAKVPGAAVTSIGLSGQMHGVVVCDRAGTPLRPAVLWSDRRSEPYLVDLRAELDEAFGGNAQSNLANPVVAGMAGPSVAALHRDEPELMQATAIVLQPKDWVRLELTGELATDPSDASATLLWDAGPDTWSGEACRVFGVDPGWLPPVHDSAASAGKLRPDVAADLGLPAGLPVATGAADTAAALLGAGIKPGETQVSTGTGGQIAQLAEVRRVDPTGRTHLFRAASLGQEGGPQWYAMAAMQNVGIAIDWALSLLAVSQDEVNKIMSSSAEQRQQDRVRFRPYLTGERTPHLDATLTGGFDGLRPSTTRAELIVAVFAGVAGAMGDGRLALSAAGYQIEEALLAGGGSLQPWWREMLADSLDITLVPHDVPDASVRGAGLLGWAAAGHHINPGVAVARSQEVFVPSRLSIDG